MRTRKILLTALAASILFPALSHAASYDEQYIASPAPAPNYQGYLLQDSAEITRFNSALINFTNDEKGKLKSVTGCSSLSDAGCEYTLKQAYRAILPACDSVNTSDCIAQVFAKTDDGKELAVETVGAFPKTGQTDFKGDPTVKLPTGGGALLVRIPGAPHDGGDLYLVKSEMIGQRDNGNAKFLMQRMQTGIFAVSISSGSYGLSVLSTDIKQYPSADWTIGGPIGNPPPSGTCVISSMTECAKAYPLPQNISFGIKLVLNNTVDGWLHGRMKSPAVTLVKETSGTQVLTVQANPIKVPLVDVWINNDAMPAGLKAYYAGMPNYGSASFGSKEQPLSQIALRRDGNSVNDENTMKEFIAWLPVIGDKAQAMPTAWMLKTMSNFGDSSNQCFGKAKGFAGVVSTNAAEYLDGPPTYKDGFLDYKVAAPHLTSTGEVFKGTYDLVMSSDVARCLYKFSKAPVSATVSVVSESGEPNIATTLVREKDNFLFLAAYNFTFSSPTVRVKLTQEAAASKATSLTCVKGKAIKKVTAVSPKCPTGYKKK